VLFQLKTPHRAVLAIALIGATAAALAWLCVRDPKVAFLLGDRRAEWIIFPSAPYVGLHPIVEMEGVFRREFTLDHPPMAAELSVCAAKRVQLTINGRPVDIHPGKNWKAITRVAVTDRLCGGTNVLEARVTNDNAPPALWLVLEAEGFRLRSDSTWKVSAMGSAWRGAVGAREPRLPGPGNLMAGGEETLTALSAVWPWWVLWGGWAAAFWLTGRRWLAHRQTPDAAAAGRWLRWGPICPLLVVAGLWLALFGNNALLIRQALGFDAQAHLNYIEYIQKHRALPLPNEGLEMFQPPLYYVISAGTLSLFGLAAGSPAGIIVLRLFTTLLGVAHVTLVFLSLRLLFPGQTGQHRVGLVLAAFLPMHLYLAQYVTNETLAALLVSASVYLCLRILKTDRDSWMSFIALGLVIGAALLTKFTAALAVPFLIVVLAQRLSGRHSQPGTALKKLGTVLGIAALISGWHYFRLWRQTGAVVIGGWDPASGLVWWQEDGYRVLAYFERFGVSLLRPFFSCTASFMDGIYSTLWGDGMCGGSPGLAFRPPWNYNLMGAGYLLALAPSILVLTGTVACGVKWFRAGGAIRFLLLGLALAVMVGLVYLNLTVPYYASVKAFYGLCALIPFCAFGAIGWEVLTRGRQRLQFALGLILMVWAVNSFAALWVHRNAAPTRVYLGLMLDLEGRPEAAASEFARAASRDSANVPAGRYWALALNKSGEKDAAREQAERVVQRNPANAAGHYALSVILAGQGRIERALDEARRAVELGPEYLPAHRLWLDCLLKAGRDDEAMAVARDSLVISPVDPDLHHALGLAMARAGDFAGATNQFAYALSFRPDWVEAHLNLGQTLLYLGNGPEGMRYLRAAVRLAPDSPVALNKLAWHLATSPDGALRDGPEAVRLAEHACAATGRRSPALLDTLAAAYAEAGRFPEAITVAEEALVLARAAGDAPTIARAGRLLDCFHSGLPFREHSAP
jgi:tetratricopeptide (TPR) repeat protein